MVFRLCFKDDIDLFKFVRSPDEKRDGIADLHFLDDGGQLFTGLDRLLVYLGDNVLRQKSSFIGGRIRNNAAYINTGLKG